MSQIFDNSKPAIEVAAGLIWNADKKGFLVARKISNKPYLNGKWELPGGKLLPEESPFKALERELNEELSLRVRAFKQLCCMPFQYPEISIKLHLIHAVAESHQIILREHSEVLWGDFKQLLSLDLVPADRPLLEMVLNQEQELIFGV